MQTPGGEREDGQLRPLCGSVLLEGPVEGKSGPDKAEDRGGTRSCRAMNVAQKLGLPSGP